MADAATRWKAVEKATELFNFKSDQYDKLHAAVISASTPPDEEGRIDRATFVSTVLGVLKGTAPGATPEITRVLNSLHAACAAHEGTLADGGDPDVATAASASITAGFHTIASSTGEADSTNATSAVLFKRWHDTDGDTAAEGAVSLDELSDVMEHTLVFMNALLDDTHRKDPLSIFDEADKFVTATFHKHCADDSDDELGFAEFQSWYAEAQTILMGAQGLDASITALNKKAAPALTAAQRAAQLGAQPQLDIIDLLGRAAKFDAEVAESTSALGRMPVSSEGLSKPLSKMSTEELVAAAHMLHEKLECSTGRALEAVVQSTSARLRITNETFAEMRTALLASTATKQLTDSISEDTFVDTVLASLKLSDGVAASDDAENRRLLRTIFEAYRAHDSEEAMRLGGAGHIDDGTVELTHLVLGFHMLIPHGELNETVDTLFKLYGQHESVRTISMDELFELTELSLIFSDALLPADRRRKPEQLLSDGDIIAHNMMKEYDADKAGGLDRDEFTSWYRATNGIPGNEKYLTLKVQAYESHRLAEQAKKADGQMRLRAGVKPRIDYGIKGVRAEAKLRGIEVFALTAPRFKELIVALGPWRDFGVASREVTTKLPLKFDPSVPLGFTIEDRGFHAKHCVSNLIGRGQAAKLGVEEGDTITTVRGVDVAHLHGAAEVGAHIQTGIKNSAADGSGELLLVFHRTEKPVKPCISEVDFVETVLKTLLSDAQPQKVSGAKATLEFLYRSIAQSEGGGHVQTDALVCGFSTMIPASDALASWEAVFDTFAQGTGVITHDRLFEAMEHAAFFTNALLIPKHRFLEDEIFEQLQSDVAEMMSGDVNEDHELSKVEFRNHFLAKKKEEARLANDVVAHRVARRVIKVMRRSEVLVSDLFERAARGGVIKQYRHLQRALAQFNIELDAGDASLLFTMFDGDGGGFIDWDEFSKLKTPSVFGLGEMPALPFQDRRPKPSASALNRDERVAMTAGGKRTIAFETAGSIGLGFALAASRDLNASKYEGLAIEAARRNVVVRIQKVVRGGQAETNGVSVNDIITAFNGVDCCGHPIKWVSDRIIKAQKKEASFTMTVQHPFTLRAALLTRRFAHRWRRKARWQVEIKKIELMLLNPHRSMSFKLRIPAIDARKESFALGIELRTSRSRGGEYSTNPAGRRFKRQWVAGAPQIHLPIKSLTAKGHGHKKKLRIGDVLTHMGPTLLTQTAVTSELAMQEIANLMFIGDAFTLTFRRSCLSLKEMVSTKYWGRVWRRRTQGRIRRRRYDRAMARSAIVLRQHWSVIYNAHPVLGFRMREVRLSHEAALRELPKYPTSSLELEPHRPEGKAYVVSVISVDKHSLAHRMGVAPGDVLIQIGSHPVEGFDLRGCERALRMARARRLPFAVTFRRRRLDYRTLSMARVVVRRWRQRTREAHERGTAQPPYSERDDGEWNEDMLDSDDDDQAYTDVITGDARGRSVAQQQQQQQGGAIAQSRTSPARGSAGGRAVHKFDGGALGSVAAVLLPVHPYKEQAPPPQLPPKADAQTLDLMRRTFRAAYTHDAEHPRCLSFVEGESFTQVRDQNISASHWAASGYVWVASTSASRPERAGYIHPNSCHETTDERGWRRSAYATEREAPPF